MERRERISRCRPLLVFGAGGRVGGIFAESLGGRNLCAPSHEELDITDLKQLQGFIRKVNPSVVVNFAAFTDVGAAEAEKDKKGTCWTVNVGGVENIINAVNPSKTRVIQISTNMAINGESVKRDESVEPELDRDKVSYYGLSKGAAEIKLREAYGKSATIVRIAHPVDAYDPEGNHYLGKMHQFWNKKRLLPALFDFQKVSITDVDDLNWALRVIIECGYYGTFHVSSADSMPPSQIFPKMLKGLMNGDELSYSTKSMQFMDAHELLRYPPYANLSVVNTQKILGMRFNNIDDIILKYIRSCLRRV